MRPFLKKQLSKLSYSSKMISQAELSIFFRQFATLIKADISIKETCNLLEKSSAKQLRQIVKQLKQQIFAGKSLSSALEKYPKYFTPLYCQLIRLGEQTGRLDMALDTVAKAHEKEIAFTKQIRQAFFYPCIILCTALLMLLIMFTFVIPKFMILFADKWDQLPFLTRTIFYVAEKFNHSFLYIGILLVSCSLIFPMMERHFHIKKKTQLILNILPGFKNNLNKIALARFARNLAVTHGAGLKITKALDLAAQTSAHEGLLAMIKHIHLKVNNGLPLYYGMQLFAFFPPVMVHMVKIGEESGNLEEMLNKVADFYEAEVEQFTKTLTQSLEPLIMLLLGVLIGGLILALYLPLFKLGNAL